MEENLLNCYMCLYHAKTLLAKQGTLLFEAWPDLAEKRDILNTRTLDLKGNLTSEICSLVNCLLTELFASQ